MSEDLIQKGGIGLVNSEYFNPTDIGKFITTVKDLISQGEHFHHRHTGTKMILFTGMSENNLVDIQVQGGDKLRQLFVISLDMGSTEGMELEINWQDPERTEFPYMQEKVQKFTKGQVSPKVMDMVRESPVYTGKIEFSTPATNEDLKNLTQILENTKTDRQLLQKLVDHEERMGQYEYEGKNKSRRSLGSKIIRLLTKVN